MALSIRQLAKQPVLYFVDSVAPGRQFLYGNYLIGHFPCGNAGATRRHRQFLYGCFWSLSMRKIRCHQVPQAISLWERLVTFHAEHQVPQDATGNFSMGNVWSLSMRKIRCHRQFLCGNVWSLSMRKTECHKEPQVISLWELLVTFHAEN